MSAYHLFSLIAHSFSIDLIVYIVSGASFWVQTDHGTIAVLSCFLDRTGYNGEIFYSQFEHINNKLGHHQCIDVALWEGINASPPRPPSLLFNQEQASIYSIYIIYIPSSFFLCLLFYDRCMNLRISACLKVVLWSVYLCLLYLSLIKGSY